MEEKFEETTVKNPDILTIVMFRYFLEQATRLSHKKLIESGQHSEVCELFGPATSRQISHEQMEYALLYYTQRPDELPGDVDDTLATLRHMMNKALRGE